MKKKRLFIIIPIVFSIIMAIVYVNFFDDSSSPNDEEFERLRKCANQIALMYAEDTGKNNINILADCSDVNFEHNVRVDKNDHITIYVKVYSEKNNSKVKAVYPALIDEEGQAKVGIEYAIFTENKTVNIHLIISAFTVFAIVTLFLSLLIDILFFSHHSSDSKKK